MELNLQVATRRPLPVSGPALCMARVLGRLTFNEESHGFESRTPYQFMRASFNWIRTLGYEPRDLEVRILPPVPILWGYRFKGKSRHCHCQVRSSILRIPAKVLRPCRLVARMRRSQRCGERSIRSRATNFPIGRQTTCRETRDARRQWGKWLGRLCGHGTGLKSQQ